MHTPRRFRVILAACVILAVAVCWIAWDLLDRTPHELRSFDGHQVARLETAMWHSYYDHERLPLFRQLGELLRRQYHLPFWQSNIAAYHAARAAVVFQRGHGRDDYMQALPDLQSFYTMIRRHSSTGFDADAAARLELEWWIIHRERAHHSPADLERALAQLQAEIYRRPANDFATHAKARADAMLLRDDKAARAGAPSDHDWQMIGALLDHSWMDLETAVAQ